MTAIVKKVTREFKKYSQVSYKMPSSDHVRSPIVSHADKNRYICNIRYILVLAIIALFIRVNFYAVCNYNQKYATENFTRDKLLQKVYRCIRLYDANDVTKSCEYYKPEYTLFNNERIAYKNSYYVYNLFVMSTIIIIISV